MYISLLFSFTFDVSPAPAIYFVSFMALSQDCDLNWRERVFALISGLGFLASAMGGVVVPGLWAVVVIVSSDAG